MKKFHLSALAASLALMVAGAHAAQAPTANLYVNGTLDVPPCTVAAEGDGLYDYGDLGPQDIKPGTLENKLAPISKRWTINCEGDTYLTYKVTDNADTSVSATGNDKFGLGNVNGTGKIGYYTVRMLNSKVDDKDTRVFATDRGIVSDNANTSASVRKSNFSMGWLQSAAYVQQIGKVFEADLEVTATLAGTQTMNGPIKDDVQLEGSLTLTFAYGL